MTHAVSSAAERSAYAARGAYDIVRFADSSCGDWKITSTDQPAGSFLDRSSARWDFYGMRLTGPAAVQFHEPTRWHRLTDRDGVWMSDVPVEVDRMRMYLDLDQPSGDVLVLGLGLGVVSRMLMEIPEVVSVTVVERSASVIDLVGTLPEGVTVVHAQAAEYLAKAASSMWRYDYVFADTWCGDNVSTFFKEVLPLRVIGRSVVNGYSSTTCLQQQTFRCWCEDVMRGQLIVEVVSACGDGDDDAQLRRFAAYVAGADQRRWLSNLLRQSQSGSRGFSTELSRRVGEYVLRYGDCELLNT